MTVVGTPYQVEVTPESAGWAHTSLRIVELPAAGEHRFATAGDELIVVPLSGAVRVTAGDEQLDLAGRTDVFAGPTDVAYVGRDCDVILASTEGGRFALCGARTSHALPARRLEVADVPVERRGAGQSSRQVRNFGTPDTLPAGAIIACEVITPGGNWSSYPAHKHDEHSAHESVLEEIYYFEIASGPNGEPGLGLFRTSSSPGHEIDLCEEVRDRDTILVPYGWHGPAAAAPGHDMYYLNVMAGPGPERAWKITDHPEQAWVRASWADQEFDPRLVAEEVDHDRNS
jgi:5-deoxy-glucuronate isomerase